MNTLISKTKTEGAPVKDSGGAPGSVCLFCKTKGTRGLEMTNPSKAQDAGCGGDW